MSDFQVQTCTVEKPYLREDSSGVAIVIVQDASEYITASYDTLWKT